MDDCHCSKLCVELCPAVLALEDIHITDRNFGNLLLSGNQVEEIKSELTRNKGETEASDNYFYQRMCSGLTMEVVNEVCSVLQGLHTNDKIMEKLPHLEEKNMAKRS